VADAADFPDQTTHRAAKFSTNSVWPRSEI